MHFLFDLHSSWWCIHLIHLKREFDDELQEDNLLEQMEGRREQGFLKTFFSLKFNLGKKKWSQVAHAELRFRLAPFIGNDKERLEMA